MFQADFQSELEKWLLRVFAPPLLSFFQVQTLISSQGKSSLRQNSWQQLSNLLILIPTAFWTKGKKQVYLSISKLSCHI